MKNNNQNKIKVENNLTREGGFDRIKDMWEIWLMWHMVKIIRKNEAIWAIANLRIGVVQKLNKDYGKSPDFSMMVELDTTREIYKSDDWIKNNAPINSYALKYNKDIRAKGENSYGFEVYDSKGTQSALKEAERILNNCKKNKFLETNPKDDNLIRFTKKGRSFADPSRVGLINAWLKELGLSRAIILWILSLIIAIKWKPIIDFIFPNK